jgi:hypothetical protein
MYNALWITLIGMSLVFLAILLLWGLMALLVRLTAEKPAAGGAAAGEALPQTTEERKVEVAEPDAGAEALRERRRRAAVAAVAYALAYQQGGREQPAPKEEVAAWQAVQRASQLGQRNGMSRKVWG